MKCPIDDEPLQMASRQGIEIDYCPKCRGIWLDRGELDKIIERSAPAEAPAPTHATAPSPMQGHAEGDYDDDEYSGKCRRYPKRRKGFLAELVDEIF